MRADKVLCKCNHAFQDAEHGKQVRVATPLVGKTPTSRNVRCTVCGAIHTIKA